MIRGCILADCRLGFGYNYTQTICLSPRSPGYRISYNYFRSLVPDPFLSASLLIRYRNSDGNHCGHFTISQYLFSDVPVILSCPEASAITCHYRAFVSRRSVGIKNGRVFQPLDVRFVPLSVPSSSAPTLSSLELRFFNFTSFLLEKFFIIW